MFGYQAKSFMDFQTAMNMLKGVGKESKNVTKEVVVEACRPLDGHFETYKEGVSGAIVMEINQNPKTPAFKTMFIPNVSTNVLQLSAGDDKVLTTETEKVI